MEARSINPEKERKAQAVIDALLYSPIRDWKKFEEAIRQSLNPDSELNKKIKEAYINDAKRHPKPIYC